MQYLKINVTDLYIYMDPLSIALFMFLSSSNIPRNSPVSGMQLTVLFAVILLAHVPHVMGVPAHRLSLQAMPCAQYCHNIYIPWRAGPCRIVEHDLNTYVLLSLPYYLVPTTVQLGYR